MKAELEDDFESFLAVNSDRFFRIAYAITLDEERAAEAVSSALAETYSRWRRVRAAGEPEKYMRRMILDEILGWGRRRSSAVRAITEVAPPVPVPAPGQRVLDTDLVWTALHGLPVSQRALIVLGYYERLSEDDIASTLRIRPETVGPQIAHALADLRRIVAKTRHGART